MCSDCEGQKVLLYVSVQNKHFYLLFSINKLFNGNLTQLKTARAHKKSLQKT